MAKAKKVTRHLSVRLAEDVARAVADMASAADWSESKVLNHLARVGLAFGESQDGQARALTAMFGQAVFERGVWADAQEKIRAARTAGRPDPDQLTLPGVYVADHLAPVGEPFPPEAAAIADAVFATDLSRQRVDAQAAAAGLPAPTTAAEYFADDDGKAPPAAAGASGRSKPARKPPAAGKGSKGSRKPGKRR